MAEIEPVLKELGLTRSGRVWSHPNFTPTVDIVSGPPAVGALTLERFMTKRTAFGTVSVTTPTQAAMDRLAAYFHWNDPQSLEQAVLIGESQRLDMGQIERWSAGEGHPEKFQEFKLRLAKASGRRR